MDDEPLPHRIERLVDRVQSGTATPAESAAAYAAIGELRVLADKYERDLIRALRWDATGKPVRRWADVAKAVGVDLGSRQAVHARWSRLKSDDRGTARRGRPPGQSRSS